jgi:HEPN domain-containing protein
MEIDKQIAFWQAGSEEDFEAAGVLLQQKKPRHALFFAHLALEKMLEALVTKVTSTVPPKTHNLVLLAVKAGLDLPREREDFLRRFNFWQQEGRYPDMPVIVVTGDKAQERIEEAGETLTWLKTKF